MRAICNPKNNLTHHLAMLTQQTDNTYGTISDLGVLLPSTAPGSCAAAPHLLEEVADARGAHADKHLNELGPGDGEERHARLAGDRLGQQRLACSQRRTRVSMHVRRPRQAAERCCPPT